MPLMEPNSLPARFSKWEEWREAYADRVNTYNASEKHSSDLLYLRIQLGQLGFAGVNLESEVTYIKEGGT